MRVPRTERAQERETDGRRCYDREVGFGRRRQSGSLSASDCAALLEVSCDALWFQRSLLKKVRQDLSLLSAACDGSARPSGEILEQIRF